MATGISEGEQTHPQVSCSGEVFPVLVKGNSHDSVCGVEGFLHPVTVVDVNVDVQHPLVVPGRNQRHLSNDLRKEVTHRPPASSSLLEKLQDGQDDVIDVAEARGFRLLGVMETAGPVDGNVRLLLVQFHRTS